MFNKRPSARYSLQGLPRLRSRRRADRRNARREAREDVRSQTAAGPMTHITEDTPQEPPTIEAMRVVPHEDGWALEVDDIDEPAWVVSTKKTAVASAKENARFHHAVLSVHTKDGQVQRTFDYGDAHAS
ncbi:MAG: DUF2188 domain-containing protein [Deltaproteobacteria bacterium]|nr:MAG: DUF2188 domain-containing protein [Deltaproteobacteria bacterium]